MAATSIIGANGSYTKGNARKMSVKRRCHGYGQNQQHRVFELAAGRFTTASLIMPNSLCLGSIVPLKYKLFNLHRFDLAQ